MAWSRANTRKGRGEKRGELLYNCRGEGEIIMVDSSIVACAVDAMMSLLFISHHVHRRTGRQTDKKAIT